MGGDGWWAALARGVSLITKSKCPPRNPLLMSHWPELCHMTTLSCKGCWENESLPFSGFEEASKGDGINNCVLANKYVCHSQADRVVGPGLEHMFVCL